MKDSSPDHNQMSFLSPNLLDHLNPKHPLLQLAQTIHWDFFESEFAPLYSNIGRPAKPIRLMVGLCILKHMGNVSDDVIVQQIFHGSWGNFANSSIRAVNDHSPQIPNF